MISQPTNLLEQRWFDLFLGERGFRRIDPETFANGRATIRVNQNQLTLTSIDTTRVIRSNLTGASPESIALLLDGFLRNPVFASSGELERQSAKHQSATAALSVIGEILREDQDSHSAREIRQFLWSMYNNHHTIGLWRLKNVLDSRNAELLCVVFNSWMEGYVSDDAIKQTLQSCGELDRL